MEAREEEESHCEKRAQSNDQEISVKVSMDVKMEVWQGSVSLPTDMLLSGVSVLVVAQPSLEFPEGLMNYPV